MPKHFVSNKDESVSIFENKFLDFFTRVHFIVPLIIYVPVLLYFLYQSVFVFHLSVWTIVGFIVTGLVVWTLTEYNFHRFIFHWDIPGEIGKRISFMFHGVHHDYPRDSMRLVMVPAISIPLALLFYFVFQYFFGNELVAPFFSGLVSGYLFYDMTHYALHHANLRGNFWLGLRQHHMLHHYSDPHNGFGVSTKFWDLIYRTTFRRKSITPIIVEERTEAVES
ncbi:MAG: sterol desaturase family protein [Bacteroidetes bacterium]|nr:sterol desaturase family protein [Bacteroidota bacterium]